METIKDQINKACDKAFRHYQEDVEQFSHDLTCFNETGTKCAVVYDGHSIEKDYIIVCLAITPEKEWELAMFEIRRNGAYDGIDAMLLADNYLSGNYSIGVDNPELTKKLEG